METASPNVHLTGKLDQSLRITLSVDEAMHATSLGRTKLYELLSDGSLQSFVCGKKRLILVSSINEWVQDQLSYGLGQLKEKWDAHCIRSESQQSDG